MFFERDYCLQPCAKIGNGGIGRNGGKGSNGGNGGIGWISQKSKVKNLIAGAFIGFGIRAF